MFPKGSTYPMNATTILTTRRLTPTIQTLVRLKLFMISPLNIWRYKTKKNREAPFRWRACNRNPNLMFTSLSWTELKAVVVLFVYLRVNRRPVKIWSVKIIPSNLPKFHKYLSVLGVGYFRSLILSILMFVWFLGLCGLLLQHTVVILLLVFLEVISFSLLVLSFNSSGIFIVMLVSLVVSGASLLVLLVRSTKSCSKESRLACLL